MNPPRLFTRSRAGGEPLRIPLPPAPCGPPCCTRRDARVKGVEARSAHELQQTALGINRSAGAGRLPHVPVLCTRRRPRAVRTG